MSISALSDSTSSYWTERYQSARTREAEKHQDDLATKLFTDLDSDGDEGLSLAESGLNQETFDSMDINKDGTVSYSELSAALEMQQSALLGQMEFNRQAGEAPPPPPPEGEQQPGQPDAQELLAAIMSGAASAGAASDDAVAAVEDDEEDGEGTGASGSAAGQTEYDDMDTNKDGVVSAQELAAALGQFSPFSSRLAAGKGLAGGFTSTSGGSQLSQDFLAALAGSSYSSYANYSVNNLTQGLSFSA